MRPAIVRPARPVPGDSGLALVVLAALFAVALASPTQGLAADVVSPSESDFWIESLSVSDLTAADGPQPDGRAPAVFRNGAWTPDRSTSLNAYVAVLLSKDVYFKHVIDPRDGPAVRRNFTLFARAFCRAMVRLGADDCEVIAGAGELVWAVIRAGPSVLLVVRGSNSPQNWITDVTSLRTINVGDFGGGSRGTNVALGFYKVFAGNRRLMVDRVRGAIALATASAAEAQARRSGDGGDGTDDDGAPNDRDPGWRLWVFGHSLGGAVGLMAASYLDIQEGLTATGVYTFGCPRVGDASWARTYGLHDVTLRLENAGDIVPTLPFGSGWRHVGSAASIQACRDLQPPQAATTAAAAAAVTAAAGGDGRDAQIGAAADETIQRLAAAARAAAAGQQWRRRRLLRGHGVASVGTIAAGSSSSSSSYYAAAGLALDAGEVVFPFPVSFRDHWVQTYTQVMWSCLTDSDQELVPGPGDVYDKIDA